MFEAPLRREEPDELCGRVSKLQAFTAPSTPIVENSDEVIIPDLLDIDGDFAKLLERLYMMNYRYGPQDLAPFKAVLDQIDRCDYCLRMEYYTRLKQYFELYDRHSVIQPNLQRMLSVSQFNERFEMCRSDGSLVEAVGGARPEAVRFLVRSRVTEDFAYGVSAELYPRGTEGRGLLDGIPGFSHSKDSVDVLSTEDPSENRFEFQ